MAIKWGKMGRFLACTGYPSARTPRTSRKSTGRSSRWRSRRTDETCEKCGRADGHQARAVRALHGLLRLPGVQVSKPPVHRRGLPRPARWVTSPERRSRRGKVFFGCQPLSRTAPSPRGTGRCPRPVRSAPRRYLLQKSQQARRGTGAVPAPTRSAAPARWTRADRPCPPARLSLRQPARRWSGGVTSPDLVGGGTSGQRRPGVLGTPGRARRTMASHVFPWIESSLRTPVRLSPDGRDSPAERNRLFHEHVDPPDRCVLSAVPVAGSGVKDSIIRFLQGGRAVHVREHLLDGLRDRRGDRARSSP